MLKFIDQTVGAGKAEPVVNTRVSIAVAADHGGFELKELIKDYLKQLGVGITDFGTNSNESTDYPDYAHLVSRAVADRKSDFGILVCTSGVGMSIAANKVPGIRAALVWNEDM